MTPADKRKEKGEKTKAAIMKAVMEIVITEGKQGLTTRNIVERAGIGKGSLYHHFKNMDDILEHLIKSIRYQTIRKIESAEYESLEEFFLKMGMLTIDHVEAILRKGSGGLTLWEDMISNKRIHDVIVETNDEYVKILGYKIENLAKISISEKKLKMIVWSLLTFLGGMKTYLLLIDDYELFRELWTNMAKIFTNSILNGEKV